MKFSVIIPVYNAEKYIAGTLKTFNGSAGRARRDDGLQADYEVLLIENGSSDKSAEICEQYASDNNYIRTFHYGPIGPFAARRKGIEQARGEYLVFVDADDELDEKALPSLLGYIDKWEEKGISPDVIIYNAADYHNRDSRIFNFPFKEDQLYKGDEKIIFYDIMSCSDAINAMWNKCIRREFALETASFEDIDLHHGEDLLQTAEFIDKADSIVYLDQNLYYYRQNSNGLTGNFHERFMADQERAWELFDEYVDRWSRTIVMSDRGLRKVLGIEDKDYQTILSSRKTLTCAIGVKNLIYSRLSMSEKKNRLKVLMNMPFYDHYALKELPDWASEEDSFVHELMTLENPYGELIDNAFSHALKSFVKRLLGRQ